MNTRYVLVLAVASVLFLTGCTTTRDERHLARLMQHRDWPRIQQVAEAEVKRREQLSGWPDTAGYLPYDHTKKVWIVMAMSGTRSGDVGRVITLMISDDGNVLAYQPRSEGLP